MTTPARATTYWAQLLHFYQPPWQEHDVLRRIADESYRPLLRVLNEFRGARIAVNVNAVLAEMWLDHGMGDIVDELRELAERDQVEFVGSGRFHPILPLIAPSLAIRSITENAERNEASFGPVWRAQGFFPPEMAIDESTLCQARQTGHEWVAASGIACLDEWPIHDLITVGTDAGQITMLFRDDDRSNGISFRATTAGQFVDDLSRSHGPNPAASYVFTAMDAETFGHHIPGWEREFLATAYERMEGACAGERHVRMVRPGELATLFPSRPGTMPRPSSWSTSDRDVQEGDPFPLWNSPQNPLHKAQWELVDTAVALVELANAQATDHHATKYARRADEALQPALQSCQFWWGSRRPMWEPELVYRGLELLMHAVAQARRSLLSSATSDASTAESVALTTTASRLRVSIEEMLFGTPTK